MDLRGLAHIIDSFAIHSPTRREKATANTLTLYARRRPGQAETPGFRLGHASVVTLRCSPRAASGGSSDPSSVSALRSSSCMALRIETRILCLDFPRFVIIDERHRYWTGRGWSRQMRDALLYADADLLQRDVERLRSKRDP